MLFRYILDTFFITILNYLINNDEIHLFLIYYIPIFSVSRGLGYLGSLTIASISFLANLILKTEGLSHDLLEPNNFGIMVISFYGIAMLGGSMLRIKRLGERKILETVQQIDELIIAEKKDISDVLEQILRRSIEATNSEKGYIEILEGNSSSRRISIPSGGFSTEFLKIERKFFNKVLETKKRLAITKLRMAVMLKSESALAKSSSAIYTPIKDENDRILGVMAVFHDDYLYYRNMEFILLESFSTLVALAIRNTKLQDERRSIFETFVENLPDPVISLQKGKIDVFNKACEEILGYASEEIKGESVLRLYEDEETAREIGKQLKQKKRIVNKEVYIRSSEGKKIPVSLSALPQFDSQGYFVGSIGVFKDLTEISRLREQEKLTSIQKMINSNAKIDAVLNSISQSIIDLTQAYTCHFRLYDSDYGDFVLKGCRGIENANLLFLPRKLLGEMYAGKIAEDNASEVIIEDLRNDENLIRMKDEIFSQLNPIPPDVQEYFDTVESAYLSTIKTEIIENEIDLILNVNSQKAGFFSDIRNVEIIHEFMDLAKITVTKYRLNKRKQEVIETDVLMSQALHTLSKELQGKVSIEAICEIILNMAEEIIMPEFLSIFIWSSSSGKLKKIAEQLSGEYLYKPDEEFDPGKDGIIGQVFLSKKSKRWNAASKIDSKQFPKTEAEYGKNIKKLKKKLPSRRIKHYVCVPIREDKRVLGVILAVNKKSKYYASSKEKSEKKCLLRRGFSSDCQRDLEMIASYLSIALQTGYLLSMLTEGIIQSDKLDTVGKAFRSVAHDVIDGIRRVVVSVEVFRKKYRNNKAVLIICKRIETALNILTQHIKRITTTGEPPKPQLRKYYLYELRTNIFKSMISNAKELGNDFQINCPKKFMEFCLIIDFDQITRVFENLYSNSTDAIEIKKKEIKSFKTGKINLIVGTLNDMLQFEWRDNGIGIEQKHFPKIFSAFHTTKIHGLGLGLHDSKTIIEAHNGTIKFDENVRDKTVFKITLPYTK